MSEAAPTRFDTLLRAAIRERGLSLDAIQRQLARAGLHVGRSTLSYWQSGRRLPSTAQSLIVIRALEPILQLPPSALVDALDSARPMAHSPDPPLTMRSKALQDAIGSAGCQDAMRTIGVASFVDLMDIGSKGDIARIHSLHTLRALGPAHCYPAIYGGEPGGHPTSIHHEALGGCRIGRVVRDERENLCVSELLLDRPLSRGDTHLLQYAVHDENRIPVTSISKLVLTPPAVLAIELNFHPQMLPAWIEEFERAPHGGPDRFTRRRVLGTDRRISLIREPARRGLVGLRWGHA